MDGAFPSAPARGTTSSQAGRKLRSGFTPAQRWIRALRWLGPRLGARTRREESWRSPCLPSISSAAPRFRPGLGALWWLRPSPVKLPAASSQHQRLPQVRGVCDDQNISPK